MRLQVCCPSDPTTFQNGLTRLSLHTAHRTNHQDMAIEEMAEMSIVETHVYQIQSDWTGLVNALANMQVTIDETLVRETLHDRPTESLSLHEIVFDQIHPHDGPRTQRARTLREQPTIEVTTAVAYLERPTCHH
jgi:hypothetical protein